MRTAVLFAALATLSACAPHIRYVSTPCLSKPQLEELKNQEPPRVKDELTGKADEDLRVVSGSALRLRAWGHGLLGTLEGCNGG